MDTSARPRRRPFELTVLLVAVPLLGVGAALGVLELHAWQLLGAQNEWWGIDGGMLVDAGGRLLNGSDIYADPIFLYPPAGAVLAVPLAVAPGAGFVLAWLKLALVAVASGLAARRHGHAAIAIVIATSLTTVPVVRDVILGNVNVFLTVSMAAVVAAPGSRTAAGVFGLLVAAFAKPMLVPLILWMIVWRRSTVPWFVGAAVGLTIVAMVVAGPGSYVDWFEALMDGMRFVSPSPWNYGLSAISPAAHLAGSAAALVALGLVLHRGTVGQGLRVATVAGLVVAPYVGMAHLVLLLVPAWAGLSSIAGDPRRRRRT